MADKAGAPILAHDKAELDTAIQLQMEQAIAEAQAEAQAEACQEASQETSDKELVTVS